MVANQGNLLRVQDERRVRGAAPIETAPQTRPTKWTALGTMLAVLLATLIGAIRPASTMVVAAAVSSPSHALILGPSTACTNDPSCGVQSVLQNGDTANDGKSLEQQEAEADGFQVTIVGTAQFQSMTAAQFAAYQVIIIGDPHCDYSLGNFPYGADANQAVWEGVVQHSAGNKVLIGTDPVYHNNFTTARGDLLLANGIAFAGGKAGATGAYIDLSCAYGGTKPGTPVPLLDGLSSFGVHQFTVGGAPCAGRIAIVAQTGPTSGLSDADLSGWFCSVHEFFDHFPGDYLPLAIATDPSVPQTYSAPDVGTTGGGVVSGSPYIMVAGTGVTVRPTNGPTLSELRGGSNPSENQTTCSTSRPVNCATGAFWHAFPDFHIPGRGVPLGFIRTYSSDMASASGPLGFGWTDNYHMNLNVDGSGNVTVAQENGSVVTFAPDGSGGYMAPSRVMATLAQKPDGSFVFSRFADSTSYVFSGAGQLQSEVDRNGYVTALTYASDGRLDKVTDPSGRQLTFTYAGNLIAKITDPIGRTVSFGYDGAGNLITATDPLGRTWTFTYDSAHDLLTMTDPRGGVTTNTYNGAGQVVQQADPLGHTIAFAYGGDPTSLTGATNTVTDALGNETTYFYEDLDLLSVTRAAGTPLAATTTFAYDPISLGITSITDPNGHVTTYTHDIHGNVTSVTDALDDTIHYSYNALDELTSKTTPLSQTTAYAYDSRGNLVSITDALGNVTTVAYGDGSHPGDATAVTDSLGRVWSSAYGYAGDQIANVDPLGNKTTYTYDPVGRRTAIVPPRGNAPSAIPAQFTSTYAYDAADELLAATDPLGHTTKYVYDPDGQLVGVTDPDGRTNHYTFDPDNELISEIRPDGTSLVDYYDAAGNLVSRVDGSGHATTHTFDALNRETSVIDPLGRLTSYSYDPAGNRTGLTNASGQVTTFSYDAINALTGIDYSDGATPSVTYQYDADGQRVRMADGTGTTSYLYDALGHLTAQTDGHGATVGYAYDEMGRVATITYPNGKAVTRHYDAAGHLQSITDWLGHVTTFGYDADTDRTRETYPNGITAQAAYNNADQLVSLVDSASAGTLASFTYTRDPAAQLITSTVTGAAPSTESYTYTARNQLGSINGSGYTYDAADNVVKLANGTTQAFDAANELQTATPVASSPSLNQVVSGDQRQSSGTVTSPKVSLGANELVLAFVASDGPAPVKGVTGAGLRWTRAQQKGTALGDVEVWQAHTTTPIDSSVTAALLAPGYNATITVAGFSGAGVALGTTAVGAGSSGAPGAAVTTSGPSSVVWGIGHNWGLGATTAVTPNSGQQVVHQFTDRRILDNMWVQRTGVVSSKGTTVNMGDTAPSTGQWVFASVEITAATSGVPITYTYDMQGNRIAQTPVGGSPLSLSYDQANRLIGYGSVASYRYNGDDLRQSKTVDGATTNFVWDQSQGLPLLVEDGSDYYVYGDGGMPVEKITPSTVTYIHQDGRGNTRLLTDGTGAEVGTYSYDAFGRLIGHAGAATSALTYSGQYFDSESGLLYLRARYYDPATAQFLSQDPLEALTRSPYAYVNNNPLNAIDPTGLCGWTDPFGCIGDAAGAVASGASTAWHATTSAVGSAAGVVGGAAKTVFHDVLDVVATIPYGEYYFSYQIARGINWVGSQFGTPGSVISHILALPFTIPEADGLAGDAALDWIKGHTVNNESICDEGIRGGILPRFIFGGGPKVYLPGIHADGSVDFEW